MPITVDDAWLHFCFETERAEEKEQSRSNGSKSSSPPPPTNDGEEKEGTKQMAIRKVSIK